MFFVAEKCLSPRRKPEQWPTALFHSFSLVPVCWTQSGSIILSSDSIFVSILQRDSGYIANEKTHDLQYGLSLLLISMANFGEEFFGILCQINLLMFP